ncbi:MAG: hypothetical protein MIO93_16685 [ANME-2 cluster archaeon]|nr:hypothetical protein [ANME-2 cluster archaeon]
MAYYFRVIPFHICRRPPPTTRTPQSLPPFQLQKRQCRRVETDEVREINPK